MDDEPDAYQTFVLRLWRARCRGQWEWRASIEVPRTGERQVFAGLQRLFAYLSERCDRQVPDPPDTCPAPGPPSDTVLRDRCEDCGVRGKGQYPRGAPGT